MVRQNKVVIVEASPLISAGVEKLLEETEYEVAAVFTDLRKAMERLSVIKPNVLILNPLQLEFTRRLSLHDALPICSRSRSAVLA